MEIRKARLIGNSIHIAIPPRWLEYLRIGRGSYVEIELREDEVAIRPLQVVKEVQRCP